MNNMLSKLDKYKYGFFAMIAFYVIFSSIHIQYGFVERPDISHLLNRKPDDVIELKLEPMEMVEQRMNATGEVKNAARDENSNGKSSGSGDNSSYESQYKNAKSLSDVEQSVYDLERSMFEETGGVQRRAEIQGEMDKRKKQQEELNKTKNTSKSAGGTQNSVGDSPKGEVLVSYSLKSRSGSYVPAPGYMCPQGTTGKIIINVKVDQSGKVIEARVNSSSTTNDCMTSYALDFAKKSRFNYSSTAPGSQDGTITYTFVN
jgi:TonB family protein